MTEPRPYCYRCMKPQVVCVCGGPRVRNRTQVVVVQHPREMHHPIGTERLARLGLENCTVHVAWKCIVTPEMVPPGAALLFPSDAAREITELTEAEKPRAIVAIDGTWSQARALYRDNPWLAGIPHVKLTQAPPSNYRIRKEPRADYVSTLEAVVHALSALEPATEGFDALLGHFAGMVDRQLAFSEKPPEGSYRHRRRTPRPLRPDPLLRDPQRSPVVGYVEYVAHEHAGVTEQRLVHVCVERIRDNERLEIFAQPVNDELPRETHLHHMGLTREAIAQGLDASGIAAALRAFVREDDVLVAWNTSTLNLLEPLAPWAAQLCLKGAYANYTRRAPGEPETIAPKDVLEHDIRYSGRAGRRMAAALSITRWLCAQ